ncbi:uncharacterized protein N7459_005685 [Penicillium hispanicum]|uniref:uncharacterized protein n=1 Tax=Penicillium hispanicum TaxID=1080232 RepID=UPI00254157FB|nr:uncharacterized protein N7459_005685 [Penicillium hispanicum]KAJ5579700.1 hypothetical protein N7459_005685 [Penicillium hispanicum]
MASAADIRGGADRLLRQSDQSVMKSALTSRSDNRTLRFTEDGTFQISVFEDLHFAEGWADATKDDKTKGVVRNILAREHAQLVVLNGDLISGEATRSSNSSDYLDEVVSPLVSSGQLWASTYGNHDSEVNLDPVKDIYEQERQYSNSLTQRSVSASKAGITNYYLPVYSHGSSQEDSPALVLWFFDSKGGHYAKNRLDDGRSGTRGDWVDESVIQWFTEAKENITATYGHAIPSLAFYHIPAHAMLRYQQQGVDSRRTPGINGEEVISQGSGDTKYSGQDSPFMQALLNTTGLIATFSGHDHDNDWYVSLGKQCPMLSRYSAL